MKFFSSQPTRTPKNPTRRREGRVFSSLLFLAMFFAPATVFASDITNIINQLPASVRSRLPASFLSSPTTQNLGGLSPSTIKSILSNIPSGTIPGLPSDMFSSIPSTSLPNVLSGLAGPLLKTLPVDTLSSLPAGTLTNVLSGLSGGALRSLPETLLSNLPQSTLTNTLSGLTGGTLGSLPASMFSSVPSSVISSLPSSITSLLPSSVTSAPAALGGIVGGGGGIFVPVNDAALNSAFSSYTSSFSTYSSNFDRYASEVNSALTGSTDSLRDIIAGKDPGGVAKEECKAGNAVNQAFAYTDGSWAAAIASTTELGLPPVPRTVPAEGEPGYPYVQVNTSGSLRCILQDLVGYQKISLFVQIQALLKQYIADAQQQQLKNRLLSQIAATNLNWAKEGEQVTADGVVTTEPVYVLNSDKSMGSRNTRTVDTIVKQAAAAEGDPVGSLGLNDPLFVATAVAQNTRNKTEDPRDSFAERTRGTLTAPGGPFSAGTDPNTAFAQYMQDANTPNGLGAVNMFEWMINNPQDTPIGAVAMVQGEADRRIAQDEARYQRELQGSGFQPTQKCSGLPSDPNCDPALMINVSPAAQNERTVADAAATGNQQIADSNITDTNASGAAASESLDINTGSGGLSGYNTATLQSSGTNVNTLINELYDTIQYAYFDSSENQKAWAQAALLSIYDEMNFNDATPATQYPGSEQNITY